MAKSPKGKSRSFNSDFSGPEQSPGFVFWRLFLNWQRGSNELLKEFDLTQPQFSVLAFVAWSESVGDVLRQQDISDSMEMDRMSVSQITRKLEDKKLIKREPSELDTRSIHVYLSKKGQRVLSACLPLVEAFDKTYFATHGVSMANVSTKGRSH